MSFLLSALIVAILFSPETIFAEVSDIADPYEGYTLIAPNSGGNGADGNNEIYLIDLEGNAVHSWQLDTNETQFAELEQDGTLLAILGASPRQTANALNQDHARLVEIDWEGNIKWEYQNDYFHHDFARLENGNVVGIVREPLDESRYSEITGDRAQANVWVDRLIEIDHETKEIVWQWGEQDELDISQYPYSGGGEIFHTNAVSYLPAGNAFNKKESLMISSRDQSVIMIIDKKYGDVVWEFGGGILEEQHDPTLLENGNVLVFNNRPSQEMSQVLEINPDDNSIVWKYESVGFFADKISGAQRLPNGNTLITEGTTGSVFEVNAEGETVWEYEVEGTTKGSNSLFRSYRYGIQDVDWPESLLLGFNESSDDSFSSIWRQHLLVIIIGFATLACFIGGFVFIKIR